jgi:synaptic vesicle membrane protein VAT-1
MRKVVVHQAGSYERLAIESCATPPISNDSVHIDVQSIGVNYADCVVRMGLYSSAKEYVGWPITPGFEVAGTVKSVGADVTHVHVNDRVFAVTRFDGYASEVVVPDNQVFHVPEALTLEQAAAFPAVHLTAYYALFDLANLKPNMNVLVHSAAGGVGSALVQLAKLSGARVVGVVGAPHKVETVEPLGADVVIDKSQEPLWERARAAAPTGFDIVLDANGVETLGQSYAHLSPAGRLVVYGFHTMMPRTGGRPNWAKLALAWLRTPRFNPLDLTTTNRSVMGFNLSYLFERNEILQNAMGELLAWVDAGRLKPPRVTTYPFDEVARAHRDLESGTTAGKLVLEV